MEQKIFELLRQNKIGHAKAHYLKHELLLLFGVSGSVCECCGHEIYLSKMKCEWCGKSWLHETLFEKQNFNNMKNDNLKNDTPTDANNVLGEGLFCGLPCQKCKHKNSVTVGNGWNHTRCRLQPHKDFFQIKLENDFVECGFEPFA